MAGAYQRYFPGPTRLHAICIQFSFMLILGNLERKKPNPVSVLIQASSLIHEVSSNSQNPNPPQQHIQNTSKLCRHPVTGTIKITSDAAFDVNRKKGVAGINGRNDKGEVVLSLTTVFPVTSALQAEAIATRDSVILASKLQVPRVTWTPREGNEAAHMVANLAKKSLLNVAWKAFPPPPQLKLWTRMLEEDCAHNTDKLTLSQLLLIWLWALFGLVCWPVVVVLGLGPFFNTI